MYYRENSKLGNLGGKPKEAEVFSRLDAVRKQGKF